MQYVNQDLNRLRHPNVLPFSASWRCYPGNLGLHPNRVAKALTYNEAGTPPTAYKRLKPVIAEDIKTGETFEFSSAKAAAAELGAHRSAISQVISGKAKSARGYRFRFAK